MDRSGSGIRILQIYSWDLKLFRVMNLRARFHAPNKSAMSVRSCPWFSSVNSLIVAFLIVRPIRPTRPLVHGWLGLVSRCVDPSVQFTNPRQSPACTTSSPLGVADGFPGSSARARLRSLSCGSDGVRNRAAFVPKKDRALKPKDQTARTPTPTSAKAFAARRASRRAFRKANSPRSTPCCRWCHRAAIPRPDRPPLYSAPRSRE